MTRTVASLAMYPFAQVREHWDRLWTRIRVDIADAPRALDWDTDLDTIWRDPDLLVGATCGWPLATELDGTVEVIGAFDPAVPFGSAGRYRSVLIGSKPLSFAEWHRLGDVTAAANSEDSLSGWVSLCAAWGGRPERVEFTGAHVESLRAVARGRAQVAAIDAVTYEFIAESEPAVAGVVHVVGHGPSIPALPLVCSARHRDRVPELRAAIAAAVADPALAPTLAALRIRGFVERDLGDYSPVVELMPSA